MDVLVGIDRLIGNTRTMAGLTGDPRLLDHLREGEQIRAAVADLVEMLRLARVWHLGDTYRFGTDEEQSAWRAQLAGYDATLARVGGAK